MAWTSVQAQARQHSCPSTGATTFLSSQHLLARTPTLQVAWTSVQAQVRRHSCRRSICWRDANATSVAWTFLSKRRCDDIRVVAASVGETPTLQVCFVSTTLYDAKKGVAPAALGLEHYRPSPVRRRDADATSVARRHDALRRQERRRTPSAWLGHLCPSSSRRRGCRRYECGLDSPVQAQVRRHECRRTSCWRDADATSVAWTSVQAQAGRFTMPRKASHPNTSDAWTEAQA